MRAARRAGWRVRDGGAADAVLICSETARHAADLRAAAEAGTPVLCEKPLAASPTPAVWVAYFLRTLEPLNRLADEVAAGCYGPAPRIDAAFAHDGAAAGWLDTAGWMGDPARAVHGGWGDLAAHWIEWLLRACGPPSALSLQRRGATHGGLETSGTGVLRFPSGAVARIDAGWTAASPLFGLRVEGSGRAALSMDAAGGTLSAAPGRGAAWSAELPPLDAGWSCAEFLDAAARGRPPSLPDAFEAAAVDRVLSMA